MKNKREKQGVFYNYLIFSILFHIVLFYVVFYFYNQIIPVFQSSLPDKNQKSLIYLEDIRENEMNNLSNVEKDDKEIIKEVGDKKGEKEELLIDKEKKVVEKEEQGREKDGDNNKGKEEKEEPLEKGEIKEDKKIEKEILTSESSDEQIKIKEEVVEETVDKEAEKKEVPPPPPPTPKDMIVNNVRPVYPKNAANTGIEGDVKLLINVRPNGEIATIDIIESSNHKSLDLIAERTIRYGWKLKANKSKYKVVVLVKFRKLSNEAVVEYIDLSFEEK